jgi:hypothetical protein
MTRRTPPMSRQLVRLLLSLAVVVSACSGGDEDGDPPATSEPTPTPTQEDRLSAIARDIYEREFALLNEPDPVRLDDLYSPDCDCYALRKETVEAAADLGWRLDGTASEVLQVTDEGGSESAPRFTVQLRSDQRFLDDQGQEVEAASTVPDGPYCQILGLEQVDDDTYRITDQFAAGCPAGWQPIDGPDEWTEVAADVFEGRYALLHDPDPDAVDRYYVPDTEAYDSMRGAVQSLVDDGSRLDGRNERPVEVTVESGPDDDGTVRLRVGSAADHGRLVGPDGETLEEYRSDRDERPCWATYGLEKQEDGSYLIADEPPVECLEEGE